jgi:hypothetical protein
MLLSQQMQASLETYAKTATKENNDAEIAAFHGSKRSASWHSPNLCSRLPVFKCSRQEQAGPFAEQTPATTKEEVPTSVAVALAGAEAKACTLSSPRYVPAGTLVISEKLVPKFKRRLLLLDRHMKTAQTDLATIRKGLHIESDGSDASSSEDIAKENPLSLYIKKEFIIQWNLNDLPVARYFNKFCDEAKINCSVNQFTEYVASKMHEQLPKLSEITTKAVTILRYAMPRHAGPMHDYFLPLRSLISNVESALELAADSISTSQMVSLAAHHKDNKGTHIFQMALVELPDPEGTDQMVLHAFIRANPSLVQNMGVSCLGQVLPDKQKTTQIDEDQEVLEQYRPVRKRQDPQQQNQFWERNLWCHSFPSWKRRREQWSGERWKDRR